MDWTLDDLHKLAQEQADTHSDPGARHDWAVICEKAASLIARAGGSATIHPICDLTPVVNDLAARVLTLEDKYDQMRAEAIAGLEDRISDWKPEDEEAVGLFARLWKKLKG